MTRRAAVTGWPVTHSRSPLIHGYWLKKFKIDGFYDKLSVEPQNAEKFYRNLTAFGLAGCNVTVPHKQVAAQACDWLDPAAEAIGAANTIWVDEDGRTCGANTDGAGFLGNLDQMAPGWSQTPETAVVLGAGGAARAVVWALLQRKFTSVYIFNRTLKKAQDLASHFGSDSIAQPWENLDKTLSKASVLVNTTSLGMSGQAELNIDLGSLPKSALVTDIVYVPLQTQLLKQAQMRGNPTVDGLGMLLHQAVPGFEKWFGQRPVVDDDLRALILEDLRKAQ